MPLGKVGSSIRDSLVGTISVASDVVQATIGVTKDSTVNTLKGARDVVQEATSLVGDTITGAVQAANETGTGIASTAKGAVIGQFEGLVK